MIIQGITREQFTDAVAKAAVLYDGNLRPLFGTDYSRTRFSARVVLGQTAYQMGIRDTSVLAPAQRRSAMTHHGGGRRINAVCWHGYRDVLRELFAINPDARVYTMLASYKGRHGFEANYPRTAEHNVGSAMNPAHMPDLCDCPIGLRWEMVLS
jgi:hypothetical protein